MFENIIDKQTLDDLSLDELQKLNEILKDIPPYDSIQEANKKALNAYKAYATTYEPYVKEIYGNEKDGVSYLIANARGTNDQSMWVDSYISSYDDELVIEYNQYIFDRHNYHDMFKQMLQEDNAIFEKIYDCILDYNSEHGLYNRGVNA